MLYQETLIDQGLNTLGILESAKSGQVEEFNMHWVLIIISLHSLPPYRIPGGTLLISKFENIFIDTVSVF